MSHMYCPQGSSRLILMAQNFIQIHHESSETEVITRGGGLHVDYALCYSSVTIATISCSTYEETRKIWTKF